MLNLEQRIFNQKCLLGQTRDSWRVSGATDPGYRIRRRIPSPGMFLALT